LSARAATQRRTPPQGPLRLPLLPKGGHAQGEDERRTSRRSATCTPTTTSQTAPVLGRPLAGGPPCPPLAPRLAPGSPDPRGRGPLGQPGPDQAAPPASGVIRVLLRVPGKKPRVQRVSGDATGAMLLSMCVPGPPGAYLVHRGKTLPGQLRLCDVPIREGDALRVGFPLLGGRRPPVPCQGPEAYQLQAHTDTNLEALSRHHSAVYNPFEGSCPVLLATWTVQRRQAFGLLCRPSPSAHPLPVELSQLVFQFLRNTALLAEAHRPETYLTRYFRPRRMLVRWRGGRARPLSVCLHWTIEDLATRAEAEWGLTLSCWRARGGSAPLPHHVTLRDLGLRPGAVLHADPPPPEHRTRVWTATPPRPQPGPQPLQHQLPQAHQCPSWPKAPQPGQHLGQP
jgi:hypothetical protein